MKTKKEILEWYLKRGEIIGHHDDYKDFWDKIDKDKIDIIEHTQGIIKGATDLCVILRKNNWRIPVTLNFYDNEVYHITY